MERSQPVGVFDSGVGGLTVVKEIIKILPYENIVYLGDTANVPYGGKSRQELIRIGRNIIEFFLEQGVKAVVAACNTSSSVSVPELRKLYPVPIVDVIGPGALDAADTTRSGRVGVIATEATVNSAAYTRHLRSLRPDVEVWEVACPRFVPLVEQGVLDGPEAEEAARQYLEPLRCRGIDTLILGCTHYPFLIPVIRRTLGDGVALVDPARATAQYLKTVLREQNMMNEGKENPRHRFLATGSQASFRVIGKLVPEIDLSEVTTIKLGR